MPGDHARLAPSSMRRIMACPGSVAMCEGATRYESVYAAQGTAAHKLLEMAMLLDIEPHRWLGEQIRGFTVDEDMADAVAHARDYVSGYLAQHPNTEVELETRVNPGALYERNDLWGTLDLSLDDWPRELAILDYKHGAGVYVDVEDNEQLFTYLVGKVAERKPRSAPMLAHQQYRIVIIQPRNRGETGPVREQVVTPQQLAEFSRKLDAAAQAADEPGAPLVVGDHCQFCPARTQCPARHEHALQVAQEEFGVLDPRLIGFDSERFARILLQVPGIAKWCKDVEEAGERYVLAGGRIPGQKVVRGKSSRSWLDDATARSTLVALGLPEDSVAPRSTVSPKQAEDLVKGSRAKPERAEVMAQIAPLIKRSEGRLSMAPETDPRPAVVQADTFDDLDGDILA